MLSEQQRSRYDELRQRQCYGALTETERLELERLVGVIESGEANYLVPATERLRQERETLEQRNRALEDLVRRKEALAKRLREFLAEAQRERRVIDRDLAAVMAGGGRESPDDE